MADNKLDTAAKDYLEVMKWSYEKQSTDFSRLESLQQSYDNIINRASWPTESEIPTGQMFTAVEENLGPAMEYLFPDSNMLQLIPMDESVTAENIRKAEWALWTTLINKVKIQRSTLRSIKDCFKLGIGYGHVDVINRRSPTVVERVMGQSRSRSLELGAAQKEIRYRYVNPGRMIPYPSGVDFNGDDATPMSFFIDPYSEEDFLALWQDGGDSVMQPGIKPEEIIKKIKSTGFGSTFNFQDILSVLSGSGMMSNQIDYSKYTMAKATIPVVKVYENNKHTWITCSGSDPKIIYQVEDKYQTIRNPNIKWSAWPDRDVWFGMSAPEADQKRSLAYDIWFNFFFDMMTWMKDRNLVYTPDAFEGKVPQILPGQPIKVSRGKAGDGASWLDSPRIDPMIVNVGQTLDAVGSKIRGMKDMSQKNYTRGGSFAFQDLMNSVEARQRLSYAILETGGLVPTIEQIMVYMQLLSTEGGSVYQAINFNRDTGNNEIVGEVVTSDDLVKPYSVMLDLRAKNRLSSMDMQNRIAIYDRVKDDPNARPEEVRMLLPLDEVTNKRLWRSREEMERLQVQDRELAIRERLAGVQKAQQKQTSGGPTEQAGEGVAGGGVGMPPVGQ